MAFADQRHAHTEGEQCALSRASAGSLLTEHWPLAEHTPAAMMGACVGGGLLQPGTPPWSHMWLRSDAKWRRYKGAGTTLNLLRTPAMLLPVAQQVHAVCFYNLKLHILASTVPTNKMSHSL